MYYHKQNISKFSDLNPPAIFKTLDKLLKYVTEIVEENHEEYSEGEDDYLMYEKDFEEIVKSGLKNKHLNYVVHTKDNMGAFWIEKVKVQ